MDLRSFEPEVSVLKKWTHNDVVGKWLKVDEAVLKSIMAALGDGDCQSLPLLGSLSPEMLRPILATAKVNTASGTRELPVFEKARFNLIFAAVRQGCDEHMVDFLSNGPPPPQVTNPGLAQATLQTAADAEPAIKIKISIVFNQASDMENTMLSQAELAWKRRTFVTVCGGRPDEDEEVTDTQLSALSKVSAARQSIAADFGIWGAHGDRIERCSKFLHYVQ